MTKKQTVKHDDLGTKFSRDEPSLIFSTELSRMSKEFLGVGQIRDGVRKERVVSMYGMINVRMDGEKVIIASRLEQNASRGRWGFFELVWDNAIGQCVYRED